MLGESPLNDHVAADSCCCSINCSHVHAHVSTQMSCSMHTHFHHLAPLGVHTQFHLHTFKTASRSWCFLLLRHLSLGVLQLLLGLIASYFQRSPPNYFMPFTTPESFSCCISCSLCSRAFTGRSFPDSFPFSASPAASAFTNRLVPLLQI